MTKTNRELEQADLIRPLSLEALEYFASDEIAMAGSTDNPLLNKFVRIGEVIMIGSTIDFGDGDGLRSKSSLQHWMLRSALRWDTYAELGRKAEISMRSEPLLRNKLHDAGYGIIQLTDKAVSGYVLKGESFDFRRADEVGRQRTVEIAQNLVGSSVTVSAI